MRTTTPPVVRTTSVSCSPDEAFEIFTHQLGQWWPLPSHSVFGSESVTVAFEQGQIVERAADGRLCHWGEVITWDPPDSLSFSWHPGRPAEERTEVTVTFRAEAGATRVELVHQGWDLLGADAEERRAGYAGDSGWTQVLAALHRHRTR
jgi:uncharacterized protein YndB with AHSA1/START domain